MFLGLSTMRELMRKGCHLPYVLLAHAPLPGKHEGVGHAFGDPPEPVTITQPVHLLRPVQVRNALYCRFAIRAVADEAKNPLVIGDVLPVLLPHVDLLSFLDNLRIGPPPLWHMLVGILGGDRLERHERLSPGNPIRAHRAKDQEDYSD